MSALVANTCWESECTDPSRDALGCVRTAGVSGSDKQKGESWCSVAVVSMVWGTLGSVPGKGTEEY